MSNTIRLIMMPSTEISSGKGQAHGSAQAA